MQLVLDNQIRRQEPTVGKLRTVHWIARSVEACLVMAFHSAEESSHVSCPRQCSKLVDGRNHEARKPPVDRFIHGNDRQRANCRRTRTRGLTHLTNRFVGLSGFGVRRNEFRENFVPHHGHSSSGIGDGFLSLSQNLLVRARALFGSLSPLLPIRFGVAARPTQRPISNGHSPEFVHVIPPYEFECADQRRGAAELVERQQAERVAHQHAEAS